MEALFRELLLCWEVKVANAIEAGKSGSHHHCHLAWQRTEQRKVCGDRGMEQMSLATVVYRDPGVTEMGCAMGSINLGDPAGDRSHPHDLITHRISHSIAASC